MTREEIIRLASQAIDATRSEVDLPVPFVLRFAVLVATAEREACAKVCDAAAQMFHASNHWDHENGAESCAAALRSQEAPN